LISLLLLAAGTLSPGFSVEFSYTRTEVQVLIDRDDERIAATTTAQHALARVALDGNHRQHGTVDGERTATGLGASNPNSGIVPSEGRGPLTYWLGA
jgi:hypothetical protein